ncbi:MAG: type II secretion system protein [Planctomycetales bacterium]|nr:type II secretion system protein [Planctomycetales bacterium]
MIRITRQPETRRGFTLLEILVVIGLISFLMVISLTVVANFITTAREKATATTIRKIHAMYQERIEAHQRSLKGPQYEAQVDAKLAQFQRAGVYGMQRKVAEILLRKDLEKAMLPQRFGELPDNLTPPATNTPNGHPDVFDQDPNYVPARHNPLTESAALMYFTLTRRDVVGVPPVGVDEFSTLEVMDTDGDGLMEFVDAWGQPLRFYRWPTRLIRSGGYLAPLVLAPIVLADRQRADLLIKGLRKKPPAGNRDPLDQDPNDALGYIIREKNRFPTLATLPGNLGINEANYHTMGPYHTLLILSAGPDADVGLYEPYDTANFGHLAAPTATAPDALTDNISNRNSQAG